MSEFNAYIGLDVHKDSVSVAIAEAGRDGEVRHWGVIRNTPEAVTSSRASWSSGTVNLMAEPTESCAGLSRAEATRQPWHP